MMRSLCTLLLLLTSCWAQAQDSMRINNGVNDMLFWRHSICGKISNSSGNDYLIPMKTLPELNSFMSAINTGVTKITCDPVLDAVNWVDSDDDNCSETNTVTFSGIDIGFEVAVEGYEYDDGPDNDLGTLSYSLNGAGYVDFWHNEDLISFPINQSIYEDISIVNGSTLRFKYCAGGGYGEFDVTITNTFTGTFLDAVNVRATTP